MDYTDINHLIAYMETIFNFWEFNMLTDWLIHKQNPLYQLYFSTEVETNRQEKVNLDIFKKDQFEKKFFNLHWLAP